jgi:hypothetical protein
LDYIDQFLDEYEYKEQVSAVTERQDHVAEVAAVGFDAGDVDSGDVSSTGKRKLTKKR